MGMGYFERRGLQKIKDKLPSVSDEFLLEALDLVNAELEKRGIPVFNSFAFDEDDGTDLTTMFIDFSELPVELIPDTSRKPDLKLVKNDDDDDDEKN